MLTQILAKLGTALVRRYVTAKAGPAEVIIDKDRVGFPPSALTYGIEAMAPTLIAAVSTLADAAAGKVASAEELNEAVRTIDYANALYLIDRVERVKVRPTRRAT